MYGKSSNLPTFTKKKKSKKDSSDWNILEDFKCVTNYPNSRNFSFWRIHKYSPNYIQALLSVSVKRRHSGTEALISSQIHLAWSLQKKSCASASFISSIKCYLRKLLTSKSIILISNYDHVCCYINGWILKRLHPYLTLWFQAPGGKAGRACLSLSPITPSSPRRPRSPCCVPHLLPASLPQASTASGHLSPPILPKSLPTGHPLPTQPLELTFFCLCSPKTIRSFSKSLLNLKSWLFSNRLIIFF